MNVLSLSNGIAPEHCQYCGIECTKHLAQCLDCNPPTSYCNSRHMVVASHIVDHIYRSGHSKIRGPWFNQATSTDLKCERCQGCDDVLKLGYFICKNYPTLSGGKGRPEVTSGRVLCIECTTISKLEYHEANWIPLIRNHALLSRLLLPCPDSREKHEILDLKQRSPPSFWSQDSEKVLLIYHSGPDYCANFMPLLNMEAKASSAEKLKMKQKVFVRHEWQHDDHLALTFDLSKNGRVEVGDTVTLRSGGTALHCKVTSADRISVRLSCEDIYPPGTNHEYVLAKQSKWTAHFEWNPTCHYRQRAALNQFAVTDDLADLRDIILGRAPSTKDPDLWSPIDPPEPFKLSDIQKEAVRTALSERFSIIHGPPGTGKTQTLTALAYSLVNSGKQVLVCAPSNTATDHLFKALGCIIGRGVWRLRDGMMKNNEGRIEYLNDLWDTPRQHVSHDKPIRKDVLCCTCVGAGIKFDRVWGNDRFDAVIIDEAAQASEPETLIPIVRGRKKLTLFGDDCQLGPVVLDDEARQSGLAYSMFRRLLMLKVPSVLLNEQYRINRHIWEATSKAFYHGRVRSLVDQVGEISGCPEFPWPKSGHPIMFWSCEGTEQKDPSGSFRNSTEAERVVKIIQCFRRLEVGEERIGVITFYEAQRREINDRLRLMQSGTHIEAQNVDAFQGQENDFIILSCVRSNDEGHVGFLDKRRINVALTRARLGLVIIGNNETLGKCEVRNNQEKKQPGDKIAVYKEGNPWVELLKGLSPYIRLNDWVIS